MIVKCPCCKGTGTLDDTVGVRLSPMQQRIYELLCRASINAPALVDRLYASRPDGGPDNALKSVHVQIYLMNKRLANVGKKIISTTRGGPGATYRIVDVV
jgi:hypothetical protein